MVIYSITNIVNGKKYFGQTTKKNPLDRWRSHKWELNNLKHDNEKLQRAWNKYGSDAFIFEVIETAQSLDELNKLEMQYIANNVEGYNIFGGGDNERRPPETGRKISAARMGHIVSEDTRRKLSLKNKGRKPTVEQLKNLSQAVSGEKNGFFGKKHSDKIKKQLSKLNTGSNHPQYGKHRSNTTKQKIAQGQRKYPLLPLIDPDGNVHQIESTVREFALNFDLDGSAVSKLLNGKMKQHKGWKLYNG